MDERIRTVGNLIRSLGAVAVGEFSTTSRSSKTWEIRRDFRGRAMKRSDSIAVGSLG